MQNMRTGIDALGANPEPDTVMWSPALPELELNASRGEGSTVIRVHT